MFSTEHLNVSPHAVIQYARRVECLDVPDDYRFRPDEYRRYVWTIYNGIKHGDALPAHCCLIFVKPGNSTRRMKRSEATYHHQTKSGTWWGTYVFDGTACYVIEDNFVVTVIVPTEEQMTLLESLLSSQPKDADPMIDAARVIMPNQTVVERSTPDIGDIEMYVPKWPEDFNGEQGALALAKVLRWIERAKPRLKAPIRLVSAPFFKPIEPAIERAFSKGAVRSITLPNGLGLSGKNILQSHDPAYREALGMVTTVPRIFEHVFVLLSRDVFKRVHGMIDGVIIDINPEDPIPKDNFVFRIDLKEPDRSKRATTFLLP